MSGFKNLNLDGLAVNLKVLLVLGVDCVAGFMKFGYVIEVILVEAGGRLGSCRLPLMALLSTWD